MTRVPPSGAGEADRVPRDHRGRAGIGRLATASTALCLARAAGAGSLSDRHPMALAASEAPAEATPAAMPAVRTVRRTALSAADEDGPGLGAGPVAGTPSPRRIFDFHPPGSGADTWRQPFVIDPNDGPLAGEVRKSTAELRAYLAAAKRHPEGNPQVASPRRCGETDVAAHRAGCVGPAAGRSLAAAPSGAPDQR